MRRCVGQCRAFDGEAVANRRLNRGLEILGESGEFGGVGWEFVREVFRFVQILLDSARSGSILGPWGWEHLREARKFLVRSGMLTEHGECFLPG